MPPLPALGRAKPGPRFHWRDRMEPPPLAQFARWVDIHGPAQDVHDGGSTQGLGPPDPIKSDPSLNLCLSIRLKYSLRPGMAATVASASDGRNTCLEGVQTAATAETAGILSFERPVNFERFWTFDINSTTWFRMPNTARAKIGTVGTVRRSSFRCRAGRWSGMPSPWRSWPI